MASEDEHETKQQQTMRNVEDPNQENKSASRDNRRKKKKVCHQLGLTARLGNGLPTWIHQLIHFRKMAQHADVNAVVSPTEQQLIPRRYTCSDVIRKYKNDNAGQKSTLDSWGKELCTSRVNGDRLRLVVGIWITGGEVKKRFLLFFYVDMEWNEARRYKQNTLSKHAFCDLSHVSPLVFVFLLKECYGYGTCKASIKFKTLQQQIYLALLHNPQAGPATLIARCLYMMHILETYYDGFNHLVLSALCRLPKARWHDEDKSNAKVCAALLLLDIFDGSVAHNDAITIKVAQVFDVQLCDIDNVRTVSRSMSSMKAETSKEVVEKYVLRLIGLQSYTRAVDFLIHFSIHQSATPLLQKMMEDRQFNAAEKWAAYLGKPALCFLVQEILDQKLVLLAYDVIRRNKLREEFPELYIQYKERSLKKLAEKGVWEIAEAKAEGNEQLLHYLVYLAMEAGYSEKVEELSHRYSLKGFLNFKETETVPLDHRFLDLNELSVEDVVWVSEVDKLRVATCYLKECKVIGVDCEWKPTYEKGSPPSKVSIMQIASEKVVYILDLITLYANAPTVLDECLSGVMQSSNILKLGYNFQCDVKMLASSYQGMNCFKHFEMLLDIQNVFKEHKGGLSGLALKILGTGLNKTRRNSNWEQRPLSKHQLEYAALDAAVLLHIFRRAGSQSPEGESSDMHSKPEWKSHILAHVDSARPAKQESKASQ